MEIYKRAEVCGQLFCPLLTFFLQDLAWGQKTKYYLRVLLWFAVPSWLSFKEQFCRFLRDFPRWNIPPLIPWYQQAVFHSWAPKDYHWTGCHHPSPQSFAVDSSSNLQASLPVPSPHRVVHFWSTGNMHIAPDVMPPPPTNQLWPARSLSAPPPPAALSLFLLCFFKLIY